MQSFYNKQNEKHAPNSPDLIRAAASVVSGQPAVSEVNRATQQAAAGQLRPRAVPPALAGISPSPTSDEAGFDSMAGRLGNITEDPNGAMEAD